MKGPQNQEKPNFQSNFVAKKQETRGNNSTNLTLLTLDFPKNVGEIANFGLG